MTRFMPNVPVQKVESQGFLGIGITYHNFHPAKGVGIEPVPGHKQIIKEKTTDSFRLKLTLGNIRANVVLETGYFDKVIR